MVDLILKAVPWQAVFALIMKLILYFVSKSAETEEAKKALLLFMDAIDDKVTIKLNDEYERQKKEVSRIMRDQADQISQLREELRKHKEGEKKNDRNDTPLGLGQPFSRQY